MNIVYGIVHSKSPICPTNRPTAGPRTCTSASWWRGACVRSHRWVSELLCTAQPRKREREMEGLAGLCTCSRLPVTAYFQAGACVWWCSLLSKYCTRAACSAHRPVCSLHNTWWCTLHSPPTVQPVSPSCCACSATPSLSPLGGGTAGPQRAHCTALGACMEIGHILDENWTHSGCMEIGHTLFPARRATPPSSRRLGATSPGSGTPCR